jgi:hypothetical protein
VNYLASASWDSILQVWSFPELGSDPALQKFRGLVRVANPGDPVLRCVFEVSGGWKYCRLFWETPSGQAKSRVIPESREEPATAKTGTFGGVDTKSKFGTTATRTFGTSTLSDPDRFIGIPDFAVYAQDD